MSASHQISLQSAILMNLNIMAGAGIFINITNLTYKLNLFGGLLYLAVGLFFLPLILVVGQLVKVYPVGGFYAFARPVSPILGFIGTWAYFFGKLASVALCLNVVTIFLKLLFPSVLEPIPSLWICLIILAFYIYLNCQNLRVGLLIQRCFVAAKLLPLLCLIVLGIYNFDINIFSACADVPFINFVTMLPTVLHCFAGFEATCAISRNIENSQVNGPKAIFYSFFAIMLIYISFQTLISMMLLSHMSQFSTYADAYPFLMNLVPVSVIVQTKLTTLLSFLIGFSVMGAAYSILFANAWNLYTLAQHNHIIASKTVRSLNKHGIPAFAVLTEGLICCLFLWITSGNQIPLQQMSALGSAIPYTISTIAFLVLTIGSRLTGALSLITCTGFIISCLISAASYNFIALYLFGFMLSVGLLMYFCCSEKK